MVTLWTRSSWLLAVLASLFVSAPAGAQTQLAVSGQTVTTGAQGRQILFRDKTSLSAGPNSSVTVTRANYDAQTETTNVVISVTKGAFRYVTGDVAGSHTVKTPLSTVGVRGTVIEGFVMPGGYEVFVLIEGAFQVCTSRMCQQVTEPGTFVLVANNRTITPPATIPPSILANLMRTVPSTNLVLENISLFTNGGRDPLVRFRDLNEARKGSAPLPPTPTSGTTPPTGPGGHHGNHHHGHGGRDDRHHSGEGEGRERRRGPGDR